MLNKFFAWLEVWLFPDYGSNLKEVRQARKEFAKLKDKVEDIESFVLRVHDVRVHVQTGRSL